ncbi:MAG: dihydrofolate reductase [Ignavibacteriales bacterium]|nr:dihydrofolate reductase [Ignavibacteriales bacterium]
MEKIIIAAVSANGVIGQDGKLPWKSKFDLQHFRKTTIGFPVIMGRKTFESIGKILDSRLNIVLSKKIFLDSKKENLLVFKSFKNAIEFCNTKNFEKVFFIGGERIFDRAMKIADRIILTKFNLIVQGDKFFPEINDKIWKLEDKKKLKGFMVLYYTRKK